MRIYVYDQEEDRNITIPIPNSLICNRLVLKKILQQAQGESSTATSFLSIFDNPKINPRTIREILNKYKGLTLVEVEEEGVPAVKIIL